MSTHVYANGREIACQAADGIASPAFPDPCWTPPPPPAGPVVIPYANTARSKTLKNGSCTVFIGGKPVALENSYFSTSTGDEPATHALSKGVMSGVIQGKAYFRSHSMDVMIEGKGVARHLDLMTHNHGGALGNTPPAPYISRAWKEDDNCKSDRERAEAECNTQDKLTPQNCGGLLSTPKVAAKKLKAIAKRLADDPEARAKVDAVLAEMQTGIGKPQAGMISTAARYAGEVRDIIDAIKKDKSLNQSTLKEITQLISNNDGKRAALNAALATLDECLLARKCKLVPYQVNGKATVDGKTRKVSSAKNGGCCPGQTGHHLITDQMVKGGTCSVYDKDTNPTGLYRTETALTVCVEGENQYHGTHGLVHAKLGDAISRLEMKKTRESPDGMMSLDEAIDVAAESHSEAFPRSKCSEECIKAQLRDYYGTTCPNARFAAVDKYGRLRKPANGGGQSTGR